MIYRFDIYKVSYSLSYAIWPMNLASYIEIDIILDQIFMVQVYITAFLSFIINIIFQPVIRGELILFWIKLY